MNKYRIIVLTIPAFWLGVIVGNIDNEIETHIINAASVLTLLCVFGAIANCRLINQMRKIIKNDKDRAEEKLRLPAD